MKTKLLSNPFIFLLVLLISFYLLGCRDGKEHDPTPETEVQPKVKVSKISRTNQDREYIYNTAGKLIQITTTNKFASGVEISSYQQIDYDSQGRIANVWMEGDSYKTETRYLYENDKISKTEEYFNDVLTSYTFYSYNNQGQLITSIIYQTDDYNQFRKYWKYTYSYDIKGNLKLLRYYLKGTKPDWEFFQSFRYENYDNSPNVEYLTTHPVMPDLNTQKNNPGKLIHTNMNNVAVESLFTYEYNAHKWSVKKIITSPKNNFTIEYSYTK